MAKFVEIVCVLFFSFFFLLSAFSHARFSSDLLQVNGIISFEPSKHLPESESKPTTSLLLPSERSEPESRLAENYIRSTESIQEDNNESNTNGETPFAIITLPRMKRHFPRRPFPFGHPCLDQQQSFRPRESHLQGHKEIIYDGDMISSGIGDMSFDPVVSSTIPAKWISVGRFPDELDDIDLGKRPLHQRRRRHHYHHHRHEERVMKDQHKHKHKHGFFKSFRKFLAYI